MAGVHAARALRNMDQLIDLTIVEPTGTHQFLTRLAAVAGGVAPLEDAAVPLDSLVDCRVVIDSVDRVSDGSVLLASGARLEAQAVIVTAGAHSSRPDVPGLRHAVGLRTAADAHEIRYRVSRSDSVVVIGGGPTGCQLAGALASGPFDVFVTLVERESGLLGGFNPLLGHRALEILSSRGVSVWTGRDVAEVAADHVLTSTGIANGVPVWAGGFEARGGELIDAPMSQGRLVIDEFGRVDGHDKVFAAGDIAAHTDGDDLRPMSAQIAVKAGRTAAFNAVQALRGQPLAPFDFTDLGWVVDLSGGQGVADVLGLPLSLPGLDRLVPLLHDAIDVRNLAQLGALGTLLQQSAPPQTPKSNDLSRR